MIKYNQGNMWNTFNQRLTVFKFGKIHNKFPPDYEQNRIPKEKNKETAINRHSTGGAMKNQ